MAATKALNKLPSDVGWDLRKALDELPSVKGPCCTPSTAKHMHMGTVARTLMHTGYRGDPAQGTAPMHMVTVIGAAFCGMLDFHKRC